MGEHFENSPAPEIPRPCGQIEPATAWGKEQQRGRGDTRNYLARRRPDGG